MKMSAVLFDYNLKILTRLNRLENVQFKWKYASDTLCSYKKLCIVNQWEIREDYLYLESIPHQSVT